MKNQVCCFTGHRHLPRAKIEQTQKLLEHEIRSLINQGVINFLNGGALGFDMLAAETVLHIKCQFPQIKLVMVLPCKNQDEKWRPVDKRRYHNILFQSDEVICLSDKYYDGCMVDRNRYMVDNSAYCIAYLTQNRSGTLYTVNYAKRNGKTIVNIA